MKPVLCYLFPASTSLQDKETGKYSHIDLFNAIQKSNLPQELLNSY